MSKILVSGSIAYDYLYTFPGAFQDQLILDSKSALSVAFTVTSKTVNFGGCAGNIAFNAKSLGEDFILLGIAGKDFKEYREWMSQNDIETNGVIIEDKEYTAQASVVTDQKGQQITFFYEGAATKSAKYVAKIKKAIKAPKDDISFAIISPNNRDFMMASIEACVENQIPFFFDPGQAMPGFNSEELLEIVKKSIGVFLNEYEFDLLTQKLKISSEQLRKLTRIVIVTLGEKGSKIWFNGSEINIKPVKPENIVDPTGCGDAYRAGFLIGIQEGFAKLTPEILERAGNLGSRVASACLQATGTQNHAV